LDEVINFDKGEFLDQRGLHVGKLMTFLKNLRRLCFDVVIVPSTVSVSFTSHIFAYLSKAPIRIGAGSIDGTENPSRFLLNATVELDWRSTPHRHQTLRNLDIAKAISVHTEGLAIELTLTEQEIEEGKRKYIKEKDTRALVIGFHPGAGKKPNCWPAEGFASVANRLSMEFDAAVFVTAGPMDNIDINQMTAGLETPYYLMKNLPLRLVASIIANTRLFISNDTGLMHVAAAVGVPVLSLFGPTDPEQWAPIGSQHRYIVGRDGNMSFISVEEVLETARGMLRAQ
jgi:ADP-heptose:LPS heptosyltransferase